MEFISKNLSLSAEAPATHLDSRGFIVLLKHINELRKDVLSNKNHELSANSFLVFLDKMSHLTRSDQLNEFLMKKISSVNLDLLHTDKMLDAYHKHSVDYRFEENLRVEEIKKFAAGVVPEARFIFDNYKVTNLHETRSLEDQKDIYDNENEMTKILERNESQRERDEDEEDDSGFEDNKPRVSSQADSIQQYSEPDNYFSFFSSHEKLIHRPRDVVKYLPVDYYVLLQENYEAKGGFEESNYVMFRNLPLIAQNLTKFKNYKHRQLTYEDLSRCIDYQEIYDMIDEEIALDEFSNQLEKYGGITDVELFTRKEQLARTVSRATPRPTQDEMDGFEEMMERVAKNEELKETDDGFEKILKAHRFELLRSLNYRVTKSNVDIAKGYVDLTEQEKEDISNSIFRKGKQMKNLNRGIFFNGIVEFKDYESKLNFLLSPAYRFGMKFFDQQGNILFNDADFANTLTISSREFSKNSLGFC